MYDGLGWLGGAGRSVSLRRLCRRQLLAREGGQKLTKFFPSLGIFNSTSFRLLCPSPVLVLAPPVLVFAPPVFEELDELQSVHGRFLLW